MLIIYRIICSPAEEHNKHTSSLGTNMEGMAGHGRITSVMHWECGWITVAFYAFTQQILRSFLKNNDSGSIQSQYFFMYMTISWYYIKEPRQQVLLAVVSCTDNCSKFQSLAMSKILYRSSDYLVISLDPTLCDHYLQEPLIFTFIFLLISAAYKCLIMPHPACSHLTPKANSSVLIHHLKLQPNKWIKHCSISQWRRKHVQFILQKSSCSLSP